MRLLAMDFAAGGGVCYADWMQLRHILISTALLAACTPKTADTGDDSGSSAADTGGAEATSATASGSTTGDSLTGASPTTSGATDDSATSTIPGTSTSTSTSTSGSTTDGETLNDDTGDMGLQGACLALCAHFDECSPGSVGPVGQCAQTCVNKGLGSPECSDASIAQSSCIAALSCEEAIKVLEGNPSSCLAELEAIDQACPGINCGGEVGGGEETCEFQRVCDDFHQTIVCDGETCTCEEDDVPGAQCQAAGLCELGPFEQRAAINACCGWDWK